MSRLLRLSALLLSALLLIVSSSLVAQTAPVLEVLYPVPGDYVSGSLTIEAAMVPRAAGHQVARMTFSVDGITVCTIQRSPFRCLWNAGKAIRPHNIRVVAELADGTRRVQTVRTRGLDHVEATTVAAVQVPATVVDGRGHFVRGLTPADFSVFEGKVRQTITGFAAEQTDVTLAVALDTSGSMSATIETVKLQAKEFLRPLPSTWPTTLLSFDHSVFTLAVPGTPHEERVRAIDRLKAWGGTALYGAILHALEQVGTGMGRKAVVVFTDGEDRNSMVSPGEVRLAIEESDAVVYFVTAGEAAQTGPTLQLLEELAETSGGRVLKGRSNDSLRDAFTEVREEIRNQYFLAYVPPKLARPGTWVPLSVKVSCPGCRVRARTGYRVARPAR